MQRQIHRREFLATGVAVSIAAALPTRARDLSYAAIRAAGAEAVRSGDVPGVVSLVWRKGRLLTADACGLRDVEAGEPMQLASIMGIASMSKPVTVALALTLVEQGRMQLSDPITRWAPEFAHMRVLRRPDGPLDDTVEAPRAITVEDLMTHRAGFTYGFLTPGPLGLALLGRFGMGIESKLSPDAWLQQLAALPLVSAPGERFVYGHSIDVLGFIAARAAGTGLREALRERVFAPLGMHDTDFWIPPEKRGRMAPVYMSVEAGQFTRTGLTGFASDQPAAYASGGQGLVSTAQDYLRFARMLMRGGAVDKVRLLQADTVKMMTTNRMTEAQRQLPFVAGLSWAGQGFGLGVSVVTDAASYAGSGRRGAFGWPGGFGGWWQADPAEDMVLLWLQECVSAPPKPGVTLTRVPGAQGTVRFQQAVYQALA